MVRVMVRVVVPVMVRVVVRVVPVLHVLLTMSSDSVEDKSDFGPANATGTGSQWRCASAASVGG